MNKTHTPNSSSGKRQRLDRWQVFTTLLRTEAEPRLPCLQISVALLLICSVIALVLLFREIPGRASAWLDLQLFANLVSITAVTFNIFCQGLKGHALRPSWHTLRLPVRTHRLVLPTLLYQCGHALVLGLLWGFLRFGAGVEEPFSFPVLLLMALTVQGHAALYWYFAFGAAGGATFFSMGVLASALLGLCLQSVLDLSLTKALLTGEVLGGCISTYVAARAMCYDARILDDLWAALSGGPDESSNAPSTQGARPSSYNKVPDAYHASRYVTGGLVPLWSIISATDLPVFASPFWAQCWFEWRRTAMWLPILVGGGGFLASVLSFPFGLIAAFPIILLPLFFISYCHNRVTPQYTAFALTLPQSSQQVGRAKNAAMAMAIVLTTLLLCLPTIPSLFMGVGAFETLLQCIEALGLQVVTATYGLLWLLEFYLAQFSFQALLFVSHRLLSWDFENDWSVAFSEFRHDLDSIPGATILLMLFAFCWGWGFVKGYGISPPPFRFPREGWFVVAALVPPIVINLLQFDAPFQYWATFYYVWVTPFIALGALFAYGLRTRLIAPRDTQVGIAVFLVFFTIEAFAYHFATERMLPLFPPMHFGHLCVVVVSPIVWYPFIVAAQRGEVFVPIRKHE